MNYSTAATNMLLMQTTLNTVGRICRTDTAAPVREKKGPFDKQYESCPSGMTIVPTIL